MDDMFISRCKKRYIEDILTIYKFELQYFIDIDKMKIIYNKEDYYKKYYHYTILKYIYDSY